VAYKIKGKIVEKLALQFLQQRNLSEQSPTEYAKAYIDTYYEIMKTLNERKNEMFMK
jgi:hypothetical protein